MTHKWVWVHEGYLTAQVDTDGRCADMFCLSGIREDIWLTLLFEALVDYSTRVEEIEHGRKIRVLCLTEKGNEGTLLHVTFLRK